MNKVDNPVHFLPYRSLHELNRSLQMSESYASSYYIWGNSLARNVKRTSLTTWSMYFTLKSTSRGNLRGGIGLLLY